MPFSVYLVDAIRTRITFTELIEPVAEAFKDYSRGLGGAPVSIFSSCGGEEGPFDRIQSSSHCVMNCGLWWISTCTKRPEPELMNL